MNLLKRKSYASHAYNYDIEPQAYVSYRRRKVQIIVTKITPSSLANDQLDAPFLYFVIRLLQSSTCFEQRRAHHQEVKLY